MGALGTSPFISVKYFLWHLQVLIIIGVYESIKKHDFDIVLVRGGYCWWVVVVEWGVDVKSSTFA